jgi:hypothetical protein
VVIGYIGGGYTMQKTLTQILEAARVATISMLLMALLVSVGYTGQGKIVCKPAAPTQIEQVSVESNLIGPSAPDQSGGKMTPSKATNSIPASIIAVPMVFKSVDERHSSDERPSYDSDLPTSLEIVQVSGHLPHSTSMISTDLGRQRTLVGAKPSGTM